MLRLADVMLVVPDQDEAIAFYGGVLGFEVVEDAIVDGKRWVKVRAGGVGLVLRKASSGAQRADRRPDRWPRAPVPRDR